jgi:hypothetical protein
MPIANRTVPAVATWLSVGIRLTDVAERATLSLAAAPSS